MTVAVSSLHLYDLCIIWLQVGSLEVTHLVIPFPGQPSPPPISGWQLLFFPLQLHLLHLPNPTRTLFPSHRTILCSGQCHGLYTSQVFICFISACHLLSHSSHPLNTSFAFSDLVCKMLPIILCKQQEEDTTKTVEFSCSSSLISLLYLLRSKHSPQ